MLKVRETNAQTHAECGLGLNAGWEANKRGPPNLARAAGCMSLRGKESEMRDNKMIGTHRIGEALRDAQFRVALVAAIALLAQAVLAKNVLDVELDFISQTMAMWVFIAFLVSGRRDRVSQIAASAAIVLATVAVLV